MKEDPDGGAATARAAGPLMVPKREIRGSSTSGNHSLDSVSAHFNEYEDGMPGMGAVKVKVEESDERPSSSHSANTSACGIGSDGSPQVGSGNTIANNKSRFRGVSYDRKKAKWRVQIKVAALGKSGVSVGYFDTEESAARAYDRAAIGLLGRQNPNLQTNFDLSLYSEESIPLLTGKTREEVKTTLKSERIKQAPRRRFTSRQRTSRFMGVGSSNRKNQWQARILVHGKVTHLGYYETEEEAARVYDKVSLALHGDHAQTNFAASNYDKSQIDPFRDLDRENLQRALGVKPMDKSSRYRGVSKKKGKWEAKVMVNRRWAYRELFDSEEAAARAYDKALWRLKPREAQSYVNFKDEGPANSNLMMAEDFGRDQASEAEGEGSELGHDEMSDDDFEYEYRPTKGTSRSESMRAKKFGSAPNLVDAPTRSSPNKSRRNSKQKRGSSQQEQEQQQRNASFVLGEGGMKFTMDSGNMFMDSSMGNVAASNTYDEPLLIRVGSETHVLPNGDQDFGVGTLGKRSSRIQRIQSDPQFNMTITESKPSLPELKHYAGANLEPGSSHEIDDLMNDREIFKGLDLGELTGSTAEMDDHDLSRINEFVNEAGAACGNDDLAGLFEDEEIALANMEQARPRKLNRSVSMVNLACQDIMDAVNVSTKPPLPPNQKSNTTDASATNSYSFRRVNTFTCPLSSFEETDEINIGYMKSQHSSEGLFLYYSCQI